jgi:hypothetical protein
MKNTEPVAQQLDRDNIFSIASNITKGALRHNSSRQPDSTTRSKRELDETRREVEDLESIASFGDGGHDRLSGKAGNIESGGLQDGAEDTGGHASFPSSGKMAYSDAGDDSACMMTGVGYPGFDVWQDEECK